uniref:Protein Vpu n=1 Tax=Human immunodeficiency virus type 1 TaxID=11676 RepID=A0A6C1A6T1_HV1|nr:vpu protein [Human immunodeficiency virus 1]QIC96509.1 vpu protein [Human immunodeficiency virus 1]QIC96527.1 vpu protein [Human immunodeficiency virus 1]QIC96536.1 vpu protein [Human immunodeficiency virus 1]QIC96545.1 vpu protein [Human immunodeficiency virus 1]
MFPLQICAIIGLVVVGILAIVVWTIVGIEYKKLLRQKKIDRILQRISERAEDSGNESDGDTEELSKLVEMGNYGLGDDNDL